MKLLFASMNCLLDPSSGAAISVRTLLEFLAARGITCSSITTTCFDQPIAATPLECLRLAGMTVLPAPELGPDGWRVARNGVAHHGLAVDALHRTRVSPLDEQRILKQVLAHVDRDPPDAVLVYGGSVFERGFLAEMHRRRIATIFYLANPSYSSLSAFEHVDKVFTDTQATSDLYRQTLGLETTVIGKFIAPPLLPQGVHDPAYVTFVNPAPEKGVTLFFRIAQLAMTALPQARFLVVESRSALDDAEKRTGLPFSQLRNLRRIGLQPDMGTVLAMTRVLLMPSLWHESGPRTTVEASAVGIPTVASDRGGIAELLGEAAITITPPAPLLANHWVIPPLSDAIPWVEALRLLLSDPEFYAERREAALRQWARHDPALRLDAIIAQLTATIARAKA